MSMLMSRHIKHSIVDYPHKKQVNPDPYGEIKSISIPHAEIRSFLTHTKTDSVDFFTKNKPFSASTQKPSFDPHAKPKTIPMPRQEKQVNFDHSHQNLFNSYPYTENISISTPHDEIK